ncbi:aminoglycoside phosphotransferase family protein [Nocardioides sp.]|uniref:aminoglycoside phosphotransferase family protein n=1 Tax=Nocardioides sp. TaxID=35761 RepID=UPI002B26F87C|nr:aminoglycoside phosphotransferase family protein [Nocardioides sp.]
MSPELSRLVRELCDEWDLTPDGAELRGHTAVVVPVVAEQGPAALKIGLAHDEETEHEHLALQHWRGRGAVRLLRADPGRSALLLERLGPQDLTDHWDVEACEVVGGLYDALHVPALPQLRTLTSYVARWTDRLAALPRSAPLPRRLVEQAVSLGRGLVTAPASNGTMIHGDLHYENVLASTREEGPDWLAIDPKPVSGDPHYEVAPLLWNRWDELSGPGSVQSVRDGVRARFHATIDAAGLDEDRARDWVVVRMLLNALWEIEEHPADGASRPDGAWLTRCLTVAKAVQD